MHNQAAGTANCWEKSQEARAKPWKMELESLPSQNDRSKMEELPPREAQVGEVQENKGRYECRASAMTSGWSCSKTSWTFLARRIYLTVWSGKPFQLLCPFLMITVVLVMRNNIRLFPPSLKRESSICACASRHSRNKSLDWWHFVWFKQIYKRNRWRTPFPTASPKTRSRSLDQSCLGYQSYLCPTLDGTSLRIDFFYKRFSLLRSTE